MKSCFVGSGRIGALLMKYLVDNSKITSWYSLPAPGPGHRRSGIRMSELLMTPVSLLQAAISCQHGPGAEYRRFSTKKMKRNMEICMTAPLLVFDLLQENPLWRQGFLTLLECPAWVVYNKGWGSEVTQLGWVWCRMYRHHDAISPGQEGEKQ